MNRSGRSPAPLDGVHGGRRRLGEGRAGLNLALARLSLARLRTRRGWLSLVGWSLLAIAAAFSARSAGLANGADHVLRGTFSVVVLPLLTYGIVSAALGGKGLRPAIRGLVAIGAAPERAALASSLVAMAVSALAGGVVAAVICLAAHGSADAPLLADLPVSFGIACLGGAAYAAYFCAGSSIGRGAMRGVFLALDFLAGSSSGIGALLTPRAHVASLLGGPAAFELSRRASSVLLVVLTLACLAFAVRVARRP